MRDEHRCCRSRTSGITGEQPGCSKQRERRSKRWERSSRNNGTTHEGNRECDRDVEPTRWVEKGSECRWHGDSDREPWFTAKEGEIEIRLGLCAGLISRSAVGLRSCRVGQVSVDKPWMTATLILYR